ncbi:hypothetical protein MMC08_006426 [Hypocenomyce scalaris]|nr:hypothetical protein [Hypocenomyce scalaris]
MRSPTVTLLLTGLGLLSLASAEGINCNGNSCKKTSDDLMDEFYQATANGASDVVTGGPLTDNTLYPLPNQQYIACDQAESICVYLTGNYPAGGINGTQVATLLGYLNSHNCWACGSVPISGNNNPKDEGVLTVDKVSSPGCDGVCGVPAPAEPSGFP